jgi:hypothetical protein
VAVRLGVVSSYAGSPCVTNAIAFVTVQLRLKWQAAPDCWQASGGGYAGHEYAGLAGSAWPPLKGLPLYKGMYALDAYQHRMLDLLLSCWRLEVCQIVSALSNNQSCVGSLAVSEPTCMLATGHLTGCLLGHCQRRDLTQKHCHDASDVSAHSDLQHLQSDLLMWLDDLLRGALYVYH